MQPYNQEALRQIAVQVLRTLYMKWSTWLPWAINRARDGADVGIESWVVPDEIRTQPIIEPTVEVRSEMEEQFQAAMQHEEVRRRADAILQSYGITNPTDAAIRLASLQAIDAMIRQPVAHVPYDGKLYTYDRHADQNQGLSSSEPAPVRGAESSPLPSILRTRRSPLIAVGIVAVILLVVVVAWGWVTRSRATPSPDSQPSDPVVATEPPPSLQVAVQIGADPVTIAQPSMTAVAVSGDRYLPLHLRGWNDTPSPHGWWCLDPDDGSVESVTSILMLLPVTEAQPVKLPIRYLPWQPTDQSTPFDIAVTSCTSAANQPVWRGVIDHPIGTDGDGTGTGSSWIIDALWDDTQDHVIITTDASVQTVMVELPSGRWMPAVDGSPDRAAGMTRQWIAPVPPDVSWFEMVSMTVWMQRSHALHDLEYEVARVQPGGTAGVVLQDVTWSITTPVVGTDRRAITVRATARIAETVTRTMLTPRHILVIRSTDGQVVPVTFAPIPIDRQNPTVTVDLIVPAEPVDILVWPSLLITIP